MEQNTFAGSATPATAQSLYRTWRSRDFAEVVGQEAVTQTLRNAVRAGSVGHAYLLTGPRGTGKTSTARILARAVNCLHPRDGEPCNECAPCLSQLESRCLDVVEIDAASHNSVDDVRELRDKAPYAPTEVTRKVYIIDEVHMLSASAFNALLKTLEEPPPHVMFILATTDAFKVPATVASRCQRLDFRIIGGDAIVARLAYVCEREGIAADREALALVARQATGSLRDALSLLEQVRAYEHDGAIGLVDVERALGLARRDTLLGVSRAIVDGDVGAALTVIGDLAANGVDMRQYSRQLIQHWRDLLLACALGGAYTIRPEADGDLAAQAASLTTGDVSAVLKALLQPDYSGRRSASAQWQLELAVAEACQHFAPDKASARPRPVTASRPSVEHAAVGPGAPPRIPAEQQSEQTPSSTSTSPAAGRPVALPPETPRTDEDAAPPAHEPVSMRPAAYDWPVRPGSIERDDDAARTPLEPMIAPRDDGVDVALPPAAPAMKPGQPVPPVRLEVAWAALLKDAPKSMSSILGAHCRLVSVIDGQAVIGIDPGATSFARGQIDKADRRAQIEVVLSRVLGSPIVVRYAAMDGDGAAFDDARSARPAAARDARGAVPAEDTFKQDAERLLRGLYRGDGARE